MAKNGNARTARGKRKSGAPRRAGGQTLRDTAMRKGAGPGVPKTGGSGDSGVLYNTAVLLHFAAVAGAAL
jgi:hypothetical protein